MGNAVPTILVGLGGIGSSVVNEIYGKIPEKSRENVAIHGFDTDVNTIRQMDHLTGHMTQTSTRKSVGEYLHEKPSLKKWFPENRFLDKKTMTEGAGQIRSVSRLAFQAAMEDKKFTDLEESIRAIFPVNSDRMIYGVRVIIITSLVGGTGSGIYLQVAMYLRWLLATKFNQSSVLIRGAFLLPDVLVETNTLDHREWDSVRANGYAAVKELNAITQSALGDAASDTGVNIELEFRPGQEDLQGRASHAVTREEMPYEFCFLYDYENTNGKNLPSVKEYLRQISQTIYLQLFSPISSKHFSQEDNQILEMINSEGKGRFCGAGTAGLSYPYESVLEYCSLRWAAGGLDDSWLQLDTLYDKEIQQHEMDLRRGVSRQRPDRGERYRWDLRNLGNGNNPHPFFTDIFRQTRIVGKDGHVGPSKAEQFVEAVQERIKETLYNDENLNDFDTICSVNRGELEIKDQARREVGRVQGNLDDYYREIEKKIPEYRTSLVYGIIEEDADKPGSVSGEDYRLNTWVLRKTNPVHPVALRAMLYEMKHNLTDEANALRDRTKSLKSEIEEYDSIYNLPETKAVESAERRLDLAREQNIFKRVMKNQYKEFLNEFSFKAEQQKMALDDYKTAKLSELVLTSILQAVEEMIKDWERFFENLKDTRSSLTLELEQLAVKFESDNDPTNEFVLAKRELLENMWTSIRGSVNPGGLPDDISSQIYLSHYHQYCERRQQLYADSVREISVEKLFREHVLGYCRSELENRYHDRLDLSVVQALRTEAGMLGLDPEHHIKTRIAALDALAYPYVPKTDTTRELMFWGVHADLEKELGEQMSQELFDGSDIADDAFSHREIVCYRAYYGLSVEDFAKFSSGTGSDTYRRDAGSYYKAYKRRIDRLNRGEATVTPHLDKNWHLQTFMPDINSTQVERDTENNDKAFIYGVLYGWIQLVNDDRSRIFIFEEASGVMTLITKAGEKAGEETHVMHEALAYNPNIYEGILERAEEKKKLDRKKSDDVSEHGFYTGAVEMENINKPKTANILDLIIRYEEGDKSNPVLKERGRRIMEQFVKEVRSYYLQSYGDHRSGTALAEAQHFIDRLKEESIYFQEADRSSRDFVEWNSQLKQAADNPV